MIAVRTIVAATETIRRFMETALEVSGPRSFSR